MTANRTIFRPLAAITAAALLWTATPAPASAQGLFGFLFGHSRRSAPQPAPERSMPRAAEDEAGIAAAAQRQADARRLLPAEVEEVSEMSALVPPQGPGIVLGRGMRKLLGAVDGLGKLRAGATADYRRDPATEGGPPSFVSGDTADPDGRVTPVTADGLLEVTKTKRTPQKAKKGLPALPPKVTHETVLVDLQGKEVALKEGRSSPTSSSRRPRARKSARPRLASSSRCARPTRRSRAGPGRARS